MLPRPITALLLACVFGACASDASPAPEIDADADTSADATPTVDASADAADAEPVPETCDDMPELGHLRAPDDDMWQIVGLGLAESDSECLSELSLGCVSRDQLPPGEWAAAEGCGVREDGTLASFNYQRKLDILISLRQNWRDCTREEKQRLNALPGCDE